MQAIEFNSSANQGIIKIPENYKDWYGSTIQVILLRPESATNSARETTTHPSRPIGLAQNKFQVSAHFFDELPEKLLEDFEGKN